MLADALHANQSSLETGRLQTLFEKQRQAFQAAPSPSAEDRLQWLEALHDLLASHQRPIIEAISEDFGNRAADETRLARRKDRQT